MSAIPSAEVVMERVRMALAEAGYPDVSMRVGLECREDGSPRIWTRRGSVPLAVWWSAIRLVDGDTASCWACFRIRDLPTREACRRGDCTHPNGPARPPRELLAAS